MNLKQERSDLLFFDQRFDEDLEGVKRTERRKAETYNQLFILFREHNEKMNFEKFNEKYWGI